MRLLQSPTGEKFEIHMQHFWKSEFVSHFWTFVRKEYISDKNESFFEKYFVRYFSFLKMKKISPKNAKTRYQICGKKFYKIPLNAQFTLPFCCFWNVKIIQDYFFFWFFHNFNSCFFSWWFGLCWELTWQNFPSNSTRRKYEPIYNFLGKVSMANVEFCHEISSEKLNFCFISIFLS